LITGAIWLLLETLCDGDCWVLFFGSRAGAKFGGDDLQPYQYCAYTELTNNEMRTKFDLSLSLSWSNLLYIFGGNIFMSMALGEGKMK
jgi:hypothetical protein